MWWTFYIMNTEQTSENIFAYIKMHYGKNVLTKIRKLEKTMIKSTISFIIFWDCLMFYQIFLLPQLKQWAIITYRHGIYELVNDVRLRILGNLEIPGKCLSFIEW